MRARSWRLLRDPFENDAREGAFTAADLERYIEGWKRRGDDEPRSTTTARPSPGSRCPLRRRQPADRGADAGDLGRRTIATASPSAPSEPARFVPGLERVIILPDTSHWAQHDEPERVGRELTEFLSAA